MTSSMEDEITYIGNFEEAEETKQNNNNNKQDKKKIKFKTNRHNKDVKKFIANTKLNFFNKKVIAFLLILILLYIVKPITFLRAKLDEKREYYEQLQSNSITDIDLLDSLTYATGAEYYKNCYNSMVSPADGLMTCHYDFAHKGIDIACDEYQGNIYAAANGYVKHIGYSEKYGNEILIEHQINGMTIYTYYANLSVINVTNGQYVYQNQVIALEGGDPDKKASVMDTEGHHLHFEVRKSENPNSGLNPIIFIK